MPRLYTTTSGLVSLAASTTKVAIGLATGAAVTATLIGWDISFDSTASGAGAVSVRVALVRCTGVSSVAGSAVTPAPTAKGGLAAAVTARAGDTTDGSAPTIIKEWLVSPTAGYSYIWPYGKELEMAVSDFLELRVTSQSGMTTCNFIADIDHQE